MCAADSLACIDMIAGARARGLDVTVEFYPYGVFMTYVNSAALSAGWRERDGMDYGDLELPDTGERLTKETFDKLHASPEPIVVLGHQNPDSVLDAIATQPLAMVASDGIREHPRNAGSFARVLARYVRDQKSMTLLDAIRKMSLMPAQRLEGATSSARRKGRVQVGADADIVVFDPESIQDKATFRAPSAPSIGVRYLLVGGTLVVDQGQVVDGVKPGRPIVADEAAR
jgi:N-acyl-D-aspartate/D-glutamate deacylase